MAKLRRSFTGGSVATTTVGSISTSGTTSFTVSSSVGWPYGSNPFYVVVEPGTANEEKMLVLRSGQNDTTITIYNQPTVQDNRGLDGTVAITHSSGSNIYPVFTSKDADEANEMAATLLTKGDLLTHGSTTFSRLAVGSNGQVLTADSTATLGVKWANSTGGSSVSDVLMLMGG